MAMPTTVTHGFVGVALGGAFFRKMPRRFWLLAVACAVVQDLDTLGLRFGVPYEHFLGHRGLSHSLPFALALSILAACLMLKYAKAFSPRWWCLWAFFFVVAASQGLLDAMTDGGLGVALFSPFDRTRYFLPWRPIQVAPIGIRGLFSSWGLRVIICEAGLIWLPLVVLLVAGRLGGRLLRGRRTPEPGGI